MEKSDDKRCEKVYFLIIIITKIQKDQQYRYPKWSALAWVIGIMPVNKRSLVQLRFSHLILLYTWTLLHCLCQLGSK